MSPYLSPINVAPKRQTGFHADALSQAPRKWTEPQIRVHSRRFAVTTPAMQLNPEKIDEALPALLHLAR